MIPICGLARRIQATVKRIDGMTSGMSESAKNNDLNGVLVRSFIHASAVPTTNEKSDAPKAKRIDVPNSRSVSLVPYAARRSSPSVHTDGVAAVCGVRKLCHSRNASGITAMYDRERDACADHDPLPLEVSSRSQVMTDSRVGSADVSRVIT